MAVSTHEWTGADGLVATESMRFIDDSRERVSVFVGVLFVFGDGVVLVRVVVTWSQLLY